MEIDRVVFDEENFKVMLRLRGPRSLEEVVGVESSTAEADFSRIG